MLNILQNLAVVVFLVATMISMGLQTTPHRLLQAFSNRGLIARSVFANVVIVPAIGYILYKLLNMPIGLAIGFIIVVAAPGSPFGLKLAELAGGEIGFSTALLVSLSVIGIFSTPLVAQILLPGDTRASFNVASVILQLILLSLAPLIIGLQIQNRNAEFARQVLRTARRISTLSFVLVFVVVLAANLNKLSSLNGQTLLAIIVSVLLSLITGWLLGGKNLNDQKALTLGTGMRNFALALLIAQSSFPNTQADVTVVAYALISFLFCAAPTIYWGRRALSTAPLTETAV